MRSIVSEGFVIALAATALGVGISAVSTPAIHALLFDVGPRDPFVLLGAPIVLMAVAISACVIPALRAASIDPTVGLRAE